MPGLDPYDEGVFVGVIVGEGHFGGDGRQPQVTLRMNTRHEALFRWLMRRFPRTKLYGPYHHGGRSYYQWMARGRALVEDVLPVLEARVVPELDEYAAARLGAMTARYAEVIARERERAALAVSAGPAGSGRRSEGPVRPPGPSAGPRGS